MRDEKHPFHGIHAMPACGILLKYNIQTDETILHLKKEARFTVSGMPATSFYTVAYSLSLPWSWRNA